jgi:hypothetical protein
MRPELRGEPMTSVRPWLWLAIGVAILGPTRHSLAQSSIPNIPFFRESHPPIQIDDDGDFLNPLNGVRAGNGSPGNPYVISGWLIDLSVWRLGGTLSSVSNVAIRIRNTTAHVVLQDNQMLNGGVGIELVNAPNVVIQGNEFANLTTSIHLPAGLKTSLRIEQNQLGGGTPIFVNGGSGTLEIVNNVVVPNGTVGMALNGLSSGAITIQGNVLGGSPEDAAISLVAVNASVSILSNDIVCPGAGPIRLPATERRAGIALLGVPGPVAIDDVKITNCRNAILVEDAVAAITGSCFAGNMNGLVLADGSASTAVHASDFVDNVGLAVLNDQNAPQSTIDATGNFWGKPGGPDQLGGPERTYGAVDTSGFANTKVAPTCGR